MPGWPETVALRTQGRSPPFSMLLLVRKEVAEFYQHTTRRVQKNQPEQVPEVTSATEVGELPTAVTEKTGASASLEQGLSCDGDISPAQVSAYGVAENMSIYSSQFLFSKIVYVAGGTDTLPAHLTAYRLLRPKAPPDVQEEERPPLL